MGKNSPNKLYGIGHVLSKNKFHETQKSHIESLSRATQSILIYFKFHRTKFHRVAWA